MQQGDPLGPLLFCLVLHQQSLHLRYDFQVLYLDDVTLGGSCEDLIHDIHVMRNAVELGLSLNTMKCETVCDDMTTSDTLLAELPGVQLVRTSQAQLLGSPIGNDECVTAALTGKVNVLRRLGERHCQRMMLSSCCAIPLHCLSCCICFGLLHVSDRPPWEHMMFAYVRFLVE